MIKKDCDEEKYDFTKYEYKVLKDLKNSVFGNGRIGIKTHIILLQFQVGLLMGGMIWILKLLFDLKAGS